jgi:glutaredoxin
MPTCPYCVKVLNAIAGQGVKGIELRDKIAHPAYAAELQESTGRGTVPCLRIDDGVNVLWMHESDDIVAYLRNL